MNKQIIALGLASALFTAGFSQNREKPVGITLGGGLANYNGDLGNGFFKADPLNLHGHLGVNAWLSPSFDLGLAIAYGDWSYKKDSIQSFKSRLFHGNINLKYKFNNGYILKENSVIAPYIFAGIGSSEIIGYYKDALGNKLVNESKGVDFTPVVGLGIKFNITNTLSAFYQNTIGFLPEDDYDNVVGKGNDMFMLHTAGIGFNIGKGKPKDSDKDGCAR